MAQTKLRRGRPKLPNGINSKTSAKVYIDHETHRLLGELAAEDRRSLAAECGVLVHEETQRREKAAAKG